LVPVTSDIDKSTPGIYKFGSKSIDRKGNLLEIINYYKVKAANFEAYLLGETNSTLSYELNVITTPNPRVKQYLCQRSIDGAVDAKGLTFEKMERLSNPMVQTIDQVNSIFVFDKDEN